MINIREQLAEILEEVAKRIERDYKIQAQFSGACDINVNIAVNVVLDGTAAALGVFRFERTGFSWRKKTMGKRTNYKYGADEGVIPLIVQVIAAALAFKGFVKLPDRGGKKKIAPKGKLEGVKLVISDYVLEAIRQHVYAQPRLECGGYLIGRMEIADDGQSAIAYVDDIFHDDSVGNAADYTFTSKYAMQAYAYCVRNYSDEPNIKKIIGNYHSHATFDAFFSGTDRAMIFSGRAPEFYLVFSPSLKHVTALFKNREQELFQVRLDYDNSLFKYHKATIPMEIIYDVNSEE